MFKPEIIQEALFILESAVTDGGIVASAIDRDNYCRVWARDAIMAGITGILLKNPKLVSGLETSVLNLAENQGAAGQIPSNIKLENGKTTEISYGGLAGRVDATTWWVIGAAILCNNTQNEALSLQLKPHVEKAFAIMEAWEFNARGLMYVPLGGNWADEYVVHGYTLYDQLLRLWAWRAASQVWHMPEWATRADRLGESIRTNYSSGAHPEHSSIYHPRAWHSLQTDNTALPPWKCQLNPNGYDGRWDMAAHAFVLLLGLEKNPQRIGQFVSDLADETGSWLLPAFYPVIQKNDPDWALLANNYSYQFKNEPYHFHNGGCWFIFMGWLSFAMASNGLKSETNQICESMNTALVAEQALDLHFHEYWSGDLHQPGGTPKLCFTAAGTLLAHLATGYQVDYLSKLCLNERPAIHS